MHFYIFTEFGLFCMRNTEHMELYPNQSFHIYNQGNNSQQVFFSDRNYKFFLWKMRAYLLPFGDLLCYCLMPNHFHWLFYVKAAEISKDALWSHVDHIEWMRRKQQYGDAAQVVNRQRIGSKAEEQVISINQSIGILLQSYAQAINKEQGHTGVVFRPKCKAKDGWIDEFVTIEGLTNAPFAPGNGYFYNCFRYIHDNPTEAGLVSKNTDWDYSSARDYAGLRKGTLCNLEMGQELIRYL